MIYLYAIFLFIIIAVPLLRALLNIYPDFLWFVDLGYQDLFLKIWSYKLVLGAIFWLIAFTFIIINLLIAFRTRKKIVNEAEVVFDKGKKFSFENIQLPDLVNLISKYKSLPIAIAAIAAFLFSSFWFVNWDKVLLFLNAVSFNSQDPIFNKDIGFYFFSYPFFKLLQGWLSGLVIVVMIAVFAIYFHKKSISISGIKVNIRKDVKIHLSIILLLLFALIAWSYNLSMYQLLYSPTGIVYGAGHTDIHAGLLGYKALFVVAIGTVFLTFISIFRKGILLPIEGVAALVIVYIVLKGFVPGVVQQVIVKPNEIEKEKLYINYGIQYTRKAYGLDKIKERSISINYNLTSKDLRENADTLSNVRLWDHRPLLKTLAQLQEIRLYYNFYDVDIDRYWLDGKYQQVMLSARELDPDKLPVRARNWINQKLTYTHGHGLVMLPVNKMTSEGLPEFYIYDIPPKMSSGLKMDSPEIYYGEATNKHIYVNTTAKEFDYPQGDKNIYTTYKSSNGIVLSNFFRKVIFAIKFRDMKLLLSSYFKKDSKVLFDRNVRLRVQKIAPFLHFDRDPYVVLVKGKIFWIIDAFTMSKYYPYAKPFLNDSPMNYIRNSVKVVVNAYSGETNFYIVDDKEPIISAYNKIFPGLFKSVKELDEEVQAHFRYPEDLFKIQAKMYSTYHMQDHQVYYNQEDLWVLPNETYEDNTQQMEPYYTLMRLPEDKKLTFRLMMPFTPAKKNNLIAWMSVNSDMPDYGDITVYKLPKEQLIYGPMQIESRIDQDTEISKQLTLWGQKGSRVIRGNLLVIPIKSSFIYVEPIYLQATQSRFPELKRVVVAYDNKIAMEQTFEEALRKVFSLNAEEKYAAAKKAVVSAVMESVDDLIIKADRFYRDAQRAIKKLDWQDYGESIKALGQILEVLKSKN